MKFSYTQQEYASIAMLYIYIKLISCEKDSNSFRMSVAYCM